MTTTNAVAKIQDDTKLIEVLQNSIYSGVKSESVAMMIDYCRANKLDIMQKPVHAVPMNVRDPQSGSYGWKDVIMPGIGLYRIQADRSGNMAGIDAPEFGEDKTETFRSKNGDSVTVTYPEWCEVKVHKIVGNHIVTFTAREYWLENYASDSAKSTAPNRMWQKRPRGQLAKCAEAQALRKGWPEIGSSATAEEMAGKTIEMGEVEVVGREPITEPREVNPEVDPVAGDVKQQPATTQHQNAGEKLTTGALKLVRAKLADKGLSDDVLCAQFGIDNIENLSMKAVNDAFHWIEGQ